MKKFNLFLFTLIFTVLFNSCTNEISGPAKNDPLEYSIRCSISQNLDESNIARTAFPSATGETFSYMLYFNCGNESFSKKVEAYDGSDFGIKIPHKGLWEVRAYGSINGDPVSSTEYILRSERIYYLNVTDENPSPFQKIIVKPVMTSGETGDISLQVEWDADTDINLAECVCPALESFGASLSKSGTIAQLIVSNVPSGSYTVDFNFYKEAGGAKILKYNATEIINVYDGFTTDTWVKHGDDDHLVVNTTPPYVTFEVTKELTRKFVNSTVYVDSNVAADAIQTGSFVAPFKTFDQAWALVGNNFNNENMASCTIYLRGDSTEHKISATSSYSVDSSKKLTIKSWDSSHPVVLTRSPEATSTLITVNSLFTTLYLQNIILEGNNSTTAEGCIYNNGGTLDLNNVTIQNFIAKKSDNLNGSKGGGIYTKGGTVKLTDVTIKDCQVETPGVDESTHAPGGAAIYKDGGELTIAGNTIIEDNKLTDGTISNIELAYGETIKISQTGNGSHIGITKAITSGNRVDFASDKTEDISNKYFSDEGYLIATWSNKGIIARTTGGLSAGYYEDVKFAADETEFFVGEGASTITFSAKVGAGTDPVAIENWNATVTYAGIDITGRVTKTAAEDKKSYKIVLPATFPEGNYYIAVRGDYNGLTYSGTETVSISDPDFRNLSAENIASVNMERYAGREMRFNIDSTVSIDQLKALTAKINTSSAKVTLDLSSANLSSMTTSGIVQRNVVKIVLPNNLSSISGSYSLFAYGSYISDVEEFEISSSNTKYCVEDGILYNKTKTEVVCYPPAKKGESFITADAVTSVGEYGIAYNRYLKTLVLSKVTTINDYACYKNTKLESCELCRGTFNGTEWTGGPGVLNKYAFSGCSALKTITIPATVWKFVGNCFTNCSSLESVTFLRTVGPTFDMSYSSCNEFEGCTNLKHIYVPRGATAGYTTPRCAQYNTWWAGEGTMHWNYLSQSGKLLEPGFVVEVD